jgi:hypothetical protein
MTAALDVAKNHPSDVVTRAYDGVASGAYEVLADEVSIQIKEGLAAPIETMYPQLRM